MSFWRDEANKVIRQTLDAWPQATREEMKKLLSEAYPFGARSMHPYKIWLDAVKKALDFKYGYEMTPSEKAKLDAMKQSGLFGGAE